MTRKGQKNTPEHVEKVRKARWLNKSKKADARKIRFYKKMGYKVLVIWDDMLLQNPIRQLNRVKNILIKA